MQNQAMLSRTSLVCVISTLFLAAVLTGCGGMGTTATSGPIAGVSLSGTVHGGQQPVSGAKVYLYATGSTGYGSASTSLLGSGTSTTGLAVDGAGNDYVTSGSSGQFTIANNFACPSTTSQVYLLAVGGNPGLVGVNNSAITLIAGVGTCSNLISTSNVILNEVSTAAAVTALQQFMTNTTHIGAPATNLAGIQTAFTALTNIFDLGGQTARATPVSGNGASPQAKLNALGNILAPCVNSTGPTSTACTGLFGAAMPSGGTLTTDAASAMLQIAQNPSANPSGLFNQINAAAPFPTTLASAPNDFTLPVTFKATGLVAPGSVVIDATGNAWFANCPTCSNVTGVDSIMGITPTGTVLSTVIAGIHKPQGIAFDLNGNLWSVNDSNGTLGDQVLKESTAGIIATGFPYSGSLSTPLGVALDRNGNAWISNELGVNIVEVGATGTLVNNISSNSGLVSTIGIGIDGTGNIFAAATGSSDIFKVNGTSLATSTFTGGGLSQPLGIAIDNADNIWSINNQSNLVTITNGGTGAAVSSGSGYGVGVAQATIIAIDGAGTGWIPNCRGGCPGSGAGTAPDDIVHFNLAGTLLNGVANGFEDASLATVGTLAIDASGNLWVTNNTGNSVTEFLGIAAPVKTPMASASATNALGVRP